jgi:hypothetical protein
MLMVTMRKNKHYYAVFLEFSKDIICNKYVDIIWCSTSKFEPPLYMSHIIPDCVSWHLCSSLHVLILGFIIT